MYKVTQLVGDGLRLDPAGHLALDARPGITLLHEIVVDSQAWPGGSTVSEDSGSFSFLLNYPLLEAPCTKFIHVSLT